MDSKQRTAIVVTSEPQVKSVVKKFYDEIKAAETEEEMSEIILSALSKTLSPEITLDWRINKKVKLTTKKTIRKSKSSQREAELLYSQVKSISIKCFDEYIGRAFPPLDPERHKAKITFMTNLSRNIQTAYEQITSEVGEVDFIKFKSIYLINSAKYCGSKFERYLVRFCSENVQDYAYSQTHSHFSMLNSDYKYFTASLLSNFCKIVKRGNTTEANTYLKELSRDSKLLSNFYSTTEYIVKLFKDRGGSVQLGVNKEFDAFVARTWVEASLLEPYGFLAKNDKKIFFDDDRLIQLGFVISQKEKSRYNQTVRFSSYRKKKKIDWEEEFKSRHVKK